MSLMDKFRAFQTADTFSQMTVADKLQATLAVIVYGMVITFAALLIIWFMTALMSRIVRAFERSQKPVAQRSKSNQSGTETSNNRTSERLDLEDESQLVAVITAAIAASLATSTDQLRVTSIKRIDDPTPAWGIAGRQDVMKSRQ